ncbi:hypothetical protein [Arenicella xantha]|uniref:Small secreted protein n=1 Tax=Arenicella xantha TaxID=644221 RepID=A0A395JMK2_9GAMM|nr:hypothetical protein [Arenicella xantha]RBP52779.1 hypothetical protein DFR28_101163 [Arenicella xantha]
MKHANLKKLLLTSLFASLVALAGCEEKGPMEKAGESIDNAVDDAGDAINDAGDEVEDAADDAADEIEDAAN